jgi:hypothetical protein
MDHANVLRLQFLEDDGSNALFKMWLEEEESGRERAETDSPTTDLLITALLASRNFMRYHDEPQRSIDRVEFRLLAVVRESIRQHPQGDCRGPGEQNVPGILESARCQT